jgi:hypothetical protein
MIHMDALFDLSLLWTLTIPYYRFFELYEHFFGDGSTFLKLVVLVDKVPPVVLVSPHQLILQLPRQTVRLLQIPNQLVNAKLVPFIKTKYTLDELLQIVDVHQEPPDAEVVVLTLPLGFQLLDTRLLDNDVLLEHLHLHQLTFFLDTLILDFILIAQLPRNILRVDVELLAGKLLLHQGLELPLKCLRSLSLKVLLHVLKVIIER